MKMAEIVYALCFFLSVLCAFLLFRKYLSSKLSLLLWTGLSFFFIAINNLILFVDLVIYPELDFSGGLLRVLSGAIGGCIRLLGLIWEAK